MDQAKRTQIPPQMQMTPPFDAYRPDLVVAELQAAAIAFGEGLRRWRVSNGWSQNTPHDWARAIGIVPVYNSQWSQLETAKLRGPEPKVFRALGAMNHLLAAESYGPITDRRLAGTVKGAHPVTHDDGTPWDAGDFYRAYIGQLEWPMIPERKPLLSPDEAAAISSGIRESFIKACLDAGSRPGPCRKALLRHVPSEHAERLGDVLLGDSWSPEELVELFDEQDQLLPLQWVADWQAGQ